MIYRMVRTVPISRQGKTYGDGAETGTVAGSHVLVEGVDGVGTAHLTELLVHVVGAGARVVADPDTEVLDLHRALLVDLRGMDVSRHRVCPKNFLPNPLAAPNFTYHVDADDLAIALLDLPELGQEIPEPRLGDDGVRREDAHAVQLGRGVGLRGQITPDDLVLCETPYFTRQLLFRFSV